MNNNGASINYSYRTCHMALFTSNVKQSVQKTMKVNQTTTLWWWKRPFHPLCQDKCQKYQTPRPPKTLQTFYVLFEGQLFNPFANHAFNSCFLLRFRWEINAAKIHNFVMENCSERTLVVFIVICQCFVKRAKAGTNPKYKETLFFKH